MTQPVLDLEGVSASYGPYRALRAVSFCVAEGASLALLGPNGAGKSTVARVVSGLVPPSAGVVRLDGRITNRWPAWRIARAGLLHVPEGRAVFASLSVEENLVHAFTHRAGRRAVPAALERVYDRYPVLAQRRREAAGALSGGQQRLLSLAKALVVPPRVLVADELSLGLAPAVLDDVYATLADLHEEGTALVVVDQQARRVLGLVERAVVLEHGAVAYDGGADGALEALERVLVAHGERAPIVVPPAAPVRRGRLSGRER